LATGAAVGKGLSCNIGVQALFKCYTLVLILLSARGRLLGRRDSNRESRGAIARVSDLLALIALKTLLVGELESLGRISASCALTLRNNLDQVLEELERVLQSRIWRAAMFFFGVSSNFWVYR
jgi:hypothetical protein